jgi:hydrogenase expression/formation protein HypC
MSGNDAGPGGTKQGFGMPASSRIPACYDDVCITCSDAAVEVTVIRLLPDNLAVVDTGDHEEEVSVALVTAQPGDRILVHAREAIAVVGATAGSKEHTGGRDSRRWR